MFIDFCWSSVPIVAHPHETSTSFVFVCVFSQRMFSAQDDAGLLASSIVDYNINIHTGDKKKQKNYGKNIYLPPMLTCLKCD